MTNKVIFLMVEGFSDETIFESLISRYSKYNIKFIMIGGDIFGDIYSRVKIQNRIKNRIEKEIIGLKVKKSDVLGILQVIDLDGCMIENTNVVIDSNQSKKTYYENDFIKVNSEKQKGLIEQKNSLKKSEISRMIKYSFIDSYKYQVYYFARTMEHVIFNEANPEEDSKVENIDKFISKLDVAIEDYLSSFLPSLEGSEYGDKYNESWNYVFKENNSLHRFTNVPLLFEFFNIFF